MRIDWEHLSPYIGFLLGMALLVLIIYRNRKFPYEQIGEQEQEGEPDED